MSDETTTTTAETAAEQTQAAETQAATTTTAELSGLHKYIGQDGKFSENFSEYEALSPYASTVAHYGSVENLAKGAAELRQRLSQMGSDKLVEIPGADAEETVVKTYRERVGAPDVATGYGLSTAPKELPQGMEWDGEHGGKVEAILHKYHVPVEAARELAALEIERERTFAEQDQSDAQAAQQAYQMEMRNKWGADYDLNMDKVKRVAEAFELDPNKIPNSMKPAMLQWFKVLNEDSRVRSAMGIGEMNAMTLNSKSRAEAIIAGRPGFERERKRYETDPEFQKQVMQWLAQA
jgi:hypothetical protein